MEIARFAAKIGSNFGRLTELLERIELKNFGLFDLINAGIHVLIEKGFQHGGDKLREAGYNLRSLAIIDQADENGFVFRKQ